MARVKGRDTIPERVVRSLLTRLGYRYRLHYRQLPGSPDIAFPGRKKVIWVHGCFWHRHSGCPLARLPKSRLEFWLPKLTGNSARDEANLQQLHDLGWRSLVIWECEIKDKDLEGLKLRIQRFLESSDASD